MNRNTFNNLIASAAWQELFITEMGWNNPQGQRTLPAVTIDGTDYMFSVVAQRNGFQVLTSAVAALPTMSLCRKIDQRLIRQANDYICIYRLGDTQHHLWACPVLRTGKRDMVIVEYETAVKADFLFSKMDGLCFDIGEQTTIIDVRQRVGQAFAVNSEKITKSFYAGFRQQHKVFAQFITGIDDHLPLYDNKRGELNRNKLWYASVMLNRLMFCYFVQKKGFLAGDTDYLSHRLQQVRDEEGGGFYRSFYRDFLVSLFHDGLNTPRHTPEWERRFGRIPYLNGGMFDIHTIERQYADIDIADDAFASLFDFFDTWQWHLDTRITATGRDINPDVLGYIFEQYINDRAAMGAYYTKEDITEYISRNCIVPFLMDRVAECSSRDAFRPDGEVWARLRESGGKYIYDAVRHGHTADWRDHLPQDVACGLITPDMEQAYRRTPVGELPKGHTPLATLRREWNRPTPPSMGLPTEIWRETIERLERVDTLLAKISGGEITSINDFITLNLDLRSFVYDLLDQTADHHLVANFYRALQAITILDPTCGSGAFLFAAMGILEPLYEVCIQRMQEWNEQNPNLFRDELQEIRAKYRSNIQYFIYKSIILRNLYGVDIMAEATEIAKLRLFLKMVAVVDVDPRADNMGLDPLPDIDFNIRCGNTLVGYANEKELDKDLIEGDMFANQEFREKIEQKLRVVARAYDVFRDVQLTQDSDRCEYAAAKTELRQQLAALNDLLSHRLCSAHGSKDYNEYLRTHQPFHWLAEFYTIIHGNGGFDVVIGNPPYVEYNKKDKATSKAVSDIYKLNGYKTIECGNLYAYVLERVANICKDNIGFIVPLSITCGDRMNSLRANVLQSYSSSVFINFEIFPQKLFEGAFQRVTILIGTKRKTSIHVAKLHRWYAIQRKSLFELIRLTPLNHLTQEYIPKYAAPIQYRIEQKIVGKPLCYYLTLSKSNYLIYYQEATNYWMKACKRIPYYKKNNEVLSPSHGRILYFGEADKDKINSIFPLLHSSLFYTYYISHSDGFHVTDQLVKSFPVASELFDNAKLHELSEALESNIKTNAYHSTRNTKYDAIEIETFKINLSKPIIDEIDTVLARHYGFTEEELDFIINYDIKYRMGDELNTENE